MITTRKMFAATPINRTIATKVDLSLASGESEHVYIENASTTDGVFAVRSEALPPAGLGIALFAPTSGNLLNILVHTLDTGLEVWIDEGVNGFPSWYRSDQFAITPGGPVFIRAFRISMPYVRVTFHAGGSVSIDGEYAVRVSTM